MNIISGNVNISNDGVATLQTASPAILNSLITVDESFHAIAFDFNIDMPGLLSVYFDAKQVFGIDSSQYPIVSNDPISSGWIWLGEEYEPGQYGITFRLDPLSAVAAIAEISNLQFIYFAAVIEPAISGDFNSDGRVDATDYVLWRKNPNGASSDYDAWRSHFGNDVSSSVNDFAETEVPEPLSRSFIYIGFAMAYMLTSRVTLRRER